MSEYPYPLFNEDGQVTCQLCGKSFLVISPRHLKYKHDNVTFGEYRNRYPDAPVSSEEFIARGKFGKVKGMFDENDNLIKKPKKTIVDEELEIDFDEESLEPSTIKEFYAEESKNDVISAMKYRILDHLRTHFTNVKMDYLIQEYAPSGHLKFEHITDFCDPVLKIIINFPNMFWHNNMEGDPTINEKLKASCWKIIEIESNSPSIKDIDKSLKIV